MWKMVGFYDLAMKEHLGGILLNSSVLTIHQLDNILPSFHYSFFCFLTQKEEYKLKKHEYKNTSDISCIFNAKDL